MQDAAEGIDEQQEKAFKTQITAFVTAMDDDFNVQNGMTSIYEMAKLMNIYSEQSVVKCDTIHFMLNEFTKITSVLGIKMPQAELLDGEIEKLIEKRNQARQAKDYQLSDEIRDQLKAQGIILEDTAQGTRWRRE